VAIQFGVGFFIGGLIFNLHFFYHLYLTQLLISLPLFTMLVLGKAIPWIVGMTIAGAISGGSLGRGLSRIAGYGFLLGSTLGGLAWGAIQTFAFEGVLFSAPHPLTDSRALASFGLYFLGSVVMWVVTFAIGGAILGAALDRQEKRAERPASPAQP